MRRVRGGSVGVVGDEHPPGASRRPQRAAVLRRAGDPRDIAAGAGAPGCRVELSGGHTVADDHEVAAAGLGRGLGELLAVGLEVGLVTAPVLGPPDGERPLEDRARPRRIRVGDDRRIEERALRADEDRS